MKIIVLSVIFSAILILSLIGCGKETVDSSDSDTGNCTPFDIIVLVSFD